MKLKVTLIKSPIGALPNHIKTVEALGLKKVGQATLKPDNAAVRGQLFQVKHMVKVEEINE